MSKVSSIVSAAVPWVLGVFGVPPLVAEGAGVVAAGVDTVVEAGKASAARNRELQAFVAKAAESFEEQCGREIAHLGDYDREVVEKRMRELLQAADRGAMLGAALIGYDEFQLRLLGAEALSGLDDDGCGYLVALSGHVHALVLSFAQSDAVLGVASTTAIRIIWRELASRPTLDQVQLLIRQAISGEVEKRRHVVGSRPRLAAGFVARNEMPALRDALEQSGVATVSALQGMRGAGKSQLASAYAEACENDLWRFVGWITASTREQAITELAAAAQATGISDEDVPEKAARQLLTWLSGAGPEPRLLVFDNVNSADDITDLIPTGPGMRVIVTTTRKATALGTPVEIGVYTRQQAIDYLQDATGVRDEEGAGAVAEDLGRLPVALTQAAVVIKGRNYDFPRYRELLSSGRGLDKVVETEDGAYPQLVGVALRLAYTDVLRGLDTDVSDVAARVLGALSLLAESGVPREWFRGLTNDEFVADEAVGALVKNSILIESEDRRIVSLHRLQSQVIREDHEEAKDFETSIAAACAALSTALDTQVDDYLAQREANREISGQLAAVLEQSHSCALVDYDRWLGLVGLSMHRSFELHDPYPVIELVDYMERFDNTMGPDHRIALYLRDVLASAYGNIGELAISIRLHEQVLESSEHVLGVDDLDTLAARSNLARAYQSAGNLKQAILLLKQAAMYSERVLGSGHPGTLMFLHNLAAAYEASGDIGLAIPLYSQALAGVERVLGPDHPTTLTFRNSLASAYGSAGETVVATLLYVRGVCDHERVLGPDHPSTLSSRNSLAYVYLNAGSIEVAIRLLERVLSDRQRVLGPDHPETLTSRNNLGIAYMQVGKLGCAIPLIVRAMRDRERVLGSRHPDTLVSRNNLAKAYESAGDVLQAIPLYEEVLDDFQEALGPDHPMTLTSRNNLAHAYVVSGDVSRALSACVLALEECERVLGSDHPLALTSSNNLASAYEMISDVSQAIPLFARTLQDRERVLGLDHPDTLTSRANLAHAYVLAGDADRAIPISEQSSQDHVRILGSAHPYTLRSRSNLAAAYESAGDAGKAVVLYEEVLGECELLLGPDHPDTLWALVGLASANLSAGNLGCAVPLYERAVAECERLLGSEHPSTLAACNGLASSYWFSGDADRAAQLFGRTLTECERLLGPNHKLTRTLLSNHDEVLQGLKGS